MRKIAEKSTILGLLHTVCVFGALLPGPPSMADLQKQADVIAVATLTSIDDSQGFETVQLSITRIIQGQLGSQPGSLSVRALVPPPQFPMLGGEAPPKTGIVPPSVIGLSGVWFLTAVDSRWQVIPLDSGTYHQLYTSLPVDAALPAPSGTVNQQLLAYLVSWYQSIPYPTRVDQDFRLFGSLDAADPKDAAVAIASLIASDRADLNGIGLAAAIRLGSVDALSSVALHAEALRSNPKLRQITDAIGQYFKPQGPAAIATLQQIVALHSDVPGLDAAAGSALQKIGTRDVLPAMAILLDSSDPQAQLRAAWFFGYFAIFTDKNGNLSGNMAGPYDSPSVHQQMPSGDSAETPAQYVQFWKAWWATNRASFGLQPSGN